MNRQIGQNGATRKERHAGTPPKQAPLCAVVAQKTAVGERDTHLRNLGPGKEILYGPLPLLPVAHSGGDTVGSDAGRGRDGRVSELRGRRGRRRRGGRHGAVLAVLLELAVAGVVEAGGGGGERGARWRRVSGIDAVGGRGARRVARRRPDIM